MVRSEHDRRLLECARELLAQSEAQVNLRWCGLDREERKRAIFAEFTRRIEDHPESEALKAALRRLADH